MDQLIWTRRLDLGLINKKESKEREEKQKRTCQADFIAIVDHRGKIKEREKINTYLDLT